MTAPATFTVQQDALLHEAAAWRLIGLLFECPKPGWREQVQALGAEVQDDRLQAAAEAAQSEASEGLYHSIFGPGGPVSPREVTYLGGVQFGYLLSELNAYYDAFAYRPATAEAEDHLSVEAGFVGYLRLKHAYALASGAPEAAAVAEEAAVRFKADHLAGMVEPIARALDAGGPSYLALAGQALFQRVGPSARAMLPMADISPDGAEDDAMTCGPA